jgi:hypothetical protein
MNVKILAAGAASALLLTSFAVAQNYGANGNNGSTANPPPASGASSMNDQAANQNGAADTSANANGSTAPANGGASTSGAGERG